jgi:hypothetical protein
MKWAPISVAVIAAGCGNLDPPPPPPFQFYVKVESDPGRPVAGAAVMRDSRQIGTTNTEGRAILTVTGREGDVTDVSVKCPPDLQSPPKPLSVRLTRIAESKAPEYGVSCPPTVRRVVVAVKADNGANLPVMYLNKPVTRTDASGAAHFALEVAPGAQFNVQLDTSDAPRLKPQNPSKPFTVGQTDEILLFEQRFDVEKPRSFVAKPTIPRALN